MQRDKVVVVNNQDEVLGVMDKMEAHQKGVLHRAFSVLILNDNGEMLLHQRALKKYHGGGLWTNACCSHPQHGEDVLESAGERLQYEMGVQCKLNYWFNFIYQAPVENGLIEHEFDHVLIGYTNQQPQPNPEEVMNWTWMRMETLKASIVNHPYRYTFWFKMLMQILQERAIDRWPVFQSK